jgi:two-component system cell cycle sensor histidine kinase/response regulator CckA
MIGMTAETKALIFDPFFSTKEKDKGTGLGLATVYGIVNQSGGFIEVDSALGRGSAFRIYFPQALSEPQKEASTEAASLARGSETILLVEDDSSFRKMTVNLLRDAGYQVIEAENGSDGIQKAQEFDGRIHLVLTDIIMPKMRGPQAAKYLALLRPDIKVLFMSGYTDGDIEKSDGGQEDPAFIQKPFSRAALTLKIREILESQKTLVDAG